MATPLQTATINYADTIGFYKNIGLYAESDHGDLPTRTKDEKEAHLPEEQRSLDIAYGHKLTKDERSSGMIYGIPFEKGLTLEDKTNILIKDMENNIKLARDLSWDKKLKKKGSSWDQLDRGYKLALTSLAYNVGGTKASDEWDSVLDAASNKDVKQFAKHLRRQENKKNTAGMDNRVLKEMYYAGLIKKASEVKDVLPLGSAKEAGIPQ
jgi:GH24 family phage-related lysozyme (muramidase)